ncbi:MAG: hypothetical protein NTZ98_17390, partial [Acidobacteria bacterium]|nr:hypothetical protein [Acidobacteriota bacterium]
DAPVADQHVAGRVELLRWIHHPSILYQQHLVGSREFRIADFGLRIANRLKSAIRNPQSAIS